MKVYVVSIVCDDEYGCTSIDAIFETEAKALAYLAEEVEARNEHYEDIVCPRSEAKYYPWFNEEGKGLPLYELTEWEVG